MMHDAGTPSSNDVKVVTDYANHNGGNEAYTEAQATVVLRAIHEVFLIKGQVPCWNAQEQVVQAVVRKLSGTKIETAPLLNRSNEAFVRTFVYNFLSALHNGAYSIPKPTCDKQSAPDAFAKLDNNDVKPPPPGFDLLVWAKENPVLAVGATAGTLVIIYATWKTVQHYRKN